MNSLFLWEHVIFTPDSPKRPPSSPDFQTDSQPHTISYSRLWSHHSLSENRPGMKLTYPNNEDEEWSILPLFMTSCHAHGQLYLLRPEKNLQVTWHTSHSNFKTSKTVRVHVNDELLTKFFKHATPIQNNDQTLINCFGIIPTPIICNSTRQFYAF